MDAAPTTRGAGRLPGSGDLCTTSDPGRVGRLDQRAQEPVGHVLCAAVNPRVSARKLARLWSSPPAVCLCAAEQDDRLLNAGRSCATALVEAAAECARDRSVAAIFRLGDLAGSGNR